MVEIFGNWGRIRTWINKLIRTKSVANLFVGEDSGKITTGNYNSFIGYQTGYDNIGGDYNNLIGYRAGYNNISGDYNNFIGAMTGYGNTNGSYNNLMGYKAGYNIIGGNYNCFMGSLSGYGDTTGSSNTFVGHQAGYNNIGGHNNVSIGRGTGYGNINGNNNIFIGYSAGYYETENFKLFIDVLTRTNEADGRIKALIYGVFDAATTNQLLRINGILQLTEIKNGSTQANAGAAANEVWKTNSHATLPDNVLMIGV